MTALLLKTPDIVTPVEKAKVITVVPEKLSKLHTIGPGRLLQRSLPPAVVVKLTTIDPVDPVKVSVTTTSGPSSWG